MHMAAAHLLKTILPQMDSQFQMDLIQGADHGINNRKLRTNSLHTQTFINSPLDH